MLSDQDRKVLLEVAVAGGLEISEGDWELLEGSRDLIPSEEEAALLISREEMSVRLAKRYQRWAAIEEGLRRGVVQLAVEGHEFVPASESDEGLGQSVEERYPEANEAFLRFARAYWTLKAWGNARPEETPSTAPGGHTVLRAAEADLGQLFFATDLANPDAVEKAQREHLSRFGAASSAVDALMRGNAVLIRARNRERAGCLGLFRWVTRGPSAP